MVLGRFLGVLVGILLSQWIKSDNLIIELFIILFWSGIGTIAGILFSYYVGPMIKLTQPTEKDGLDYWTEKYGPEMGPKAYRLWLESLDDE